MANVDQESVIKTMVKGGVGLSVLFERDIHSNRIDPDDNRFAIWDSEDLVLPLSITCLKRRKDELLLKTLMSVLSKVWGEV